MVRTKILFFVLLLTGSAYGQTINRYFVSFKDKQGTPYTLSQPQQFLTQKALQRRALMQISLTEEDLPVNPTYVANVRTTGAKTFFTSRWQNGVLIEATPAQASSIASLTSVLKVDFVAPGQKLQSGRTRGAKNIFDIGRANAVNDVQLNMLGLNEMHKEGYLGDGVDVALFDSGFPGVNTTEPFQHLFQENRIKSVFNFVHNNTNVYGWNDHGTLVFSVMAGLTSSYVGASPKANYYLFKTEDVPSEFRIEEYNWLFAAERADSLGVRVINSSLGYSDFDDPTMDYNPGQLDGRTAIVTRAARKAIDRGIVVVVSAGNKGNTSWQYVTPPADVDGILAVGSITSVGLKSTFSSIGATADGRIKPDVVAMGSGTSIILSNGNIGSANGTSLASPLVAGLVVGLIQKYPTLTVQQVYQAVINSADQYHSPDNLKGYGVPNFAAASGFLQRPNIEGDIELYPNPANGDALRIVFKEPGGETLITVHSPSGAQVFEKSLVVDWGNNPLEFDLTPFASGTYFLTIRTQRLTKTFRIIRL